MPAGAKVYIEPMGGGFETDLAAALVKKHVPVMIVDSEQHATFLIAGGNQDTKAGWAKTIFFTPAPSEHASITVKDPANGNIVYAYAWDGIAARKGAQSAAEGIAKHLKEYIEKK